MSDVAEILQELINLNSTMERIEQQNSNLSSLEKIADTLSEIKDILSDIKSNTDELHWWKESTTASVMVKALDGIENKLLR